jgi:hypothetical protein
MPHSGSAIRPAIAGGTGSWPPSQLTANATPPSDALSTADNNKTPYRIAASLVDAIARPRSELESSSARDQQTGIAAIRLAFRLGHRGLANYTSDSMKVAYACRGPSGITSPRLPGKRRNLQIARRAVSRFWQEETVRFAIVP